jgi:hypothetical protein
MPVLLGNGEVKPMAALLLGDKVGFMSPYLTPLSKAFSANLVRFVVCSTCSKLYAFRFLLTVDCLCMSAELCEFSNQILTLHNAGWHEML